MQTRVSSFVEQVLNVGSGFIVSLIVWTLIVTPYWNIKVSMIDNLTITALFTVISVARGYLWRRYFNRRVINDTK